ncbi:hypothetical protein ACQ4PT_054865 [Festuca glaucescens]
MVNRGGGRGGGDGRSASNVGRGNGGRGGPQNGGAPTFSNFHVGGPSGTARSQGAGQGQFYAGGGQQFPGYQGGAMFQGGGTFQGGAAFPGGDGFQGGVGFQGGYQGGFQGNGGFPGNGMFVPAGGFQGNNGFPRPVFQGENYGFNAGSGFNDYNNRGTFRSRRGRGATGIDVGRGRGRGRGRGSTGRGARGPSGEGDVVEEELAGEGVQAQTQTSSAAQLAAAAQDAAVTQAAIAAKAAVVSLASQQNIGLVTGNDQNGSVEPIAKKADLVMTDAHPGDDEDHGSDGNLGNLEGSGDAAGNKKEDNNDKEVHISERGGAAVDMSGAKNQSAKLMCKLGVIFSPVVRRQMDQAREELLKFLSHLSVLAQQESTPEMSVVCSGEDVVGAEPPSP